jgi:hypothetical protein
MRRGGLWSLRLSCRWGVERGLKGGDLEEKTGDFGLEGVGVGQCIRKIGSYSAI